MDSDLLLFIGLILVVLAIPAIFSALTQSYSPRGGAFLVVIGGGLIILALSTKSGGYTAAQIPEAFFGVIRRFIY
ncbi:hypothetical protein CLN94_12995 [Pseudothioclava arenosa]|uniref:50S ribosomal protein L35 n=1 Tax=Pseudothioclava arenosa TaxID=1795308 RepID=A0A2A4CMY4_9RHOB|nr:hypothetical protein CLN94_12995 [Pseudothioclava arenosa]